MRRRGRDRREREEDLLLERGVSLSRIKPRELVIAYSFYKDCRTTAIYFEIQPLRIQENSRSSTYTETPQNDLS